MRRLLLALGLVLSLPAAASAQQLLETYTAYLSWNDHFNSNGDRLTEPWQVIRQDRANYHRFGERDPLDEWDSFFASIDNRAAAERMLANGYISPAARASIVNGEALVTVEIWGRGTTGTAIRVDVVGGGTVEGAAPAPGDTVLMETYRAYLSWNDHFNSNGDRLSEPWQVIRQDRANFHRFGERDALDEWDSFFASADNRARAEAMIRDGYISPAARAAIVNGEALIRVEIYGRGGTATYLRIDVF